MRVKRRHEKSSNVRQPEFLNKRRHQWTKICSPFWKMTVDGVHRFCSRISSMTKYTRFQPCPIKRNRNLWYDHFIKQYPTLVSKRVVKKIWFWPETGDTYERIQKKNLLSSRPIRWEGRQRNPDNVPIFTLLNCTYFRFSIKIHDIHSNQRNNNISPDPNVKL